MLVLTPADRTARLQTRRLDVEPLENRELFSISPNSSEELFTSHHGGGCGCPICTGTIAFSAEMRAPASAADTTKNAFSALPQLNSLAGSQFTLFLDFNGASTTGWESSAVTTPVYDFDGDRSTYSNAELASIREIWTRVAEDYSPFNINVTTVDPGNLTNGRTAKIAIGGDYSDWFGDSAGGVAYVGGFYNNASNVGFVFSDALANGVARYVAEATSHEAGHLFGLWHQSTYNSSGGKTAEYSAGNANWAPIMGVGYYSTVTTWYNGPNNNGPSALQDDVSILAGSQNGFGYRTDNAGNTTSTAATLAVAGTSATASGVVERTTDRDYFRFSTSGGSVSFNLGVAQYGANLDSVLEIHRADDSLVISSAPTNSLGATVTTNLAAGDYYVVIRSTGVYGYLGQYALTGTVPTGTTSGGGGGDTSGGGGGTTDGGGNTDVGGGGGTTPAPEISVSTGGVNIVDNTGVVSYGTTKKGTSVTKIFTVKNDGTATLNLIQLRETTMPKGFDIVTGLGDLSLAAGESTTFSVKLKAKDKGSYGGFVSFANNDADESPFNFRVTGGVNKTGVVGGKSDVFGSSTLDVALGVTLAGQTSVDAPALDFDATVDTGDDAMPSHSLAATSVDSAMSHDFVRDACEDDTVERLEQQVNDHFDELESLLDEAIADIV